MPLYEYVFGESLILFYEINKELIIRQLDENYEDINVIYFPLKDNGRSFDYIENPDGLDEHLFKGNMCGQNQFYMYLKKTENKCNIKVGYDWNHEMGMGRDIGVMTITSIEFSQIYDTIINIGKSVRDGTDLPQEFLFDVYGNNNENRENYQLNLNNNAPVLSRNIPANSQNAITYENIQNNNAMVNFHDEYDHGRYYKRSTYEQIPIGPTGRKRNPYTQSNILGVTRYTARIPVAQGGKKRTVRKTKKLIKKIKKIKKNYKSRKNY